MKISKNYISDDKYEIVLRNDENEKFKILFGGADLYWMMSDYVEHNGFSITEEDGIFYYELEKLFRLIQEYDNPYNRLLKNNCFEWLSESYGLPEYANKLSIKKEGDIFYIKFVRNPENFSPVNTCFICFCLSGSRNQRIANAFSMMFLQFKNYDIDEPNVKVLKL